jgi:WD40 repeat protein
MRPVSFCLLLAGLAGGAAPPAGSRVDSLGDPLPPRALARLGTSRFRLEAARPALVLAPDGSTLAVYAPGPEQVFLLDAVTGRVTRRFAAAAGDGLAFLPNGRQLVCADSGTITFWDPRLGKEVRRVTLESGGGMAALSADGWLLAAGVRTSGRRAPLAVFEVQTGRQLATLEPGTAQTSAALSPDGQWLATWAAPPEGGRGRRPGGPGPREEPTRASQAVQVWDAATGKELRKIDSGLGEGVAGVAFAPDRGTLALATAGGGLQLWDVASGKRLRSWRGAMRGPGSRECVLAFSPDGKTLVLGARGGDAPPLAWDLAAGRRLRAARAPECRFHGVGFRGGRIVAFGLQSQAVVTWDLLSGKRLGGDAGHSSAITALTFRRDGRRLYTAASDGCVIAWDLAGRELRRLPGPRASFPGGPLRRPTTRGPGEGLFSPGGAYLASSERFSGLAVRDARTGQEVFTLSSGSRSGSSSLAFSRDGTLLAVASALARKPGVRLFRLESGEELPGFDPGATPAALAFDPSDRRLAVGLGAKENDPDDRQGEVRIWRTDLEREDPAFPPFPLPPAGGAAAALVFSPDGKLLLVAHADSVRLLDTAAGREVALLDVGGTLTTAPVFSPDGRSLAIGFDRENMAGHTIALWEMASGKRRWSARVGAAVTALAFAPGGRVLATGGSDTTALLWEVPKVFPGGGPRLLKLTAKDVEARWADLAGDSGEKAYQAVWDLADAPAEAVPLLAKHLRPVRPASAERLKKLIAELGDDDFDVRQRAARELEKLGETAAPALRKALEAMPDVDLRLRLNVLLRNLSAAPGGETLRALRAVQVLELAPTAAAEKVLRSLAEGAAEAALTREAKAALARLARRARE